MINDYEGPYADMAQLFIFDSSATISSSITKTIAIIGNR